MTTENKLDVVESISDEKTPEQEVVTTTEPNPLEAQIQELREELHIKDKSYKGLQTKLNQVNDELKKRGTSEARLDTLEQTQRILVAMLSERENISNVNEISTEKKTDYLKQYDEVIQQQKTKATQDTFVAQVRDYQSRTEALNLDLNSEEYLEIRDLVLDGKFDRAERKIVKLEKAKMEQKAEPKVDLEAERAKIREEERKKILIERGELEAETGQPKGGVKSFEATEEAFGRGEISFADYAAARSKAGIQ